MIEITASKMLPHKKKKMNPLILSTKNVFIAQKKFPYVKSFSSLFF